MPRLNPNSAAAPTPIAITGTRMDRNNRNALIAAACFLLAFGLVAYFLPTIMIAVGNFSTIAAGAIAILFAAAFFIVFWLRGRSQRRRDGS